MKIAILGPAHPYRGGLASIMEIMARTFQRRGNEVDIKTFTLQYPSLLFPGESQTVDTPPPADLLALSGSLPEAYEDYSKAIELNPAFAEAYYNRGIIQIFMKDTRKGCLDISKAGELGILEAYEVLKRYAQPEN